MKNRNIFVACDTSNITKVKKIDYLKDELTKINSNISMLS